MALEITDSNYKEVLAEGKPVVVDFWAPWCGPCKMVAPIIEELAAEFEGQVIIGKCDVDENGDMAAEYGIRNIPTVLFFKNGEIVDKQVDEVIESDERMHYLKPEQEIRNYFLALNYLEEKVNKNEKFSKKLILDVQKLVEKGASKEKIGLRGPMPPGVLFAVYDSKTGNPDYIPPEYCDIQGLLDELIEYVNTTDDHPLIVAAVVHYQLVTIHPFEDGNGRTARLLSGYIMDLNGYGFNGIGSLEEYFAYDIDEYYESIQMGLPALYYSGRANPPHPEIWINYFLRMVKLYSNKVFDLQLASEEEDIAGGLSFLKGKEKELLQFLIKSYRGEFTPIEVSRELSVTNKTIINRLAVLVKNGFVVPILVNKRIRSYELSEFTRDHEKEIMKVIS